MAFCKFFSSSLTILSRERKKTQLSKCKFGRCSQPFEMIWLFPGVEPVTLILDWSRWWNPVKGIKSGGDLTCVSQRLAAVSGPSGTPCLLSVMLPDKPTNPFLCCFWLLLSELMKWNNRFYGKNQNMTWVWRRFTPVICSLTYEPRGFVELRYSPQLKRCVTIATVGKKKRGMLHEMKFSNSRT